jgi:hypothetical protein
MKFSALSRLLLIGSALLITAHRLPAPISEVETPTPAPKIKRTAKEHTEKTKTENRNASTPQPSPQTHNIYAGTWSGTLNWGIEGNYEHIVVIDAAQKTATVTHVSGTTYPTLIGADGISWVTGIFHEHRWTLKPFPNGKTAVVTINGHNSAVFRREK